MNEDNICKKCDGDGYLDLVEANKNNKVAKLCDKCFGEGTVHGEYYSFYYGTEYEGFYS